MDFTNYLQKIHNVRWTRWQGYVEKIYGLIVECTGITPKVGELCHIIRSDNQTIPCEVIGVQGSACLLMPLENLDGVGKGDKVIQLDRKFTISVGNFLQGMVLNGLGTLLDKTQEIPSGAKVAIDNECPNPLLRPPIEEIFQTGVRVIDGMLTCGKGQRVGIFAGSGVGKSTLMGSLVRNSEADISVIALIGERGREVVDFINNSLREGIEKSVLVVATSDTSPIQRLKGVLTALTIAEYFRDQHKNVLFLCDSITRVAMAIREIGLARKEPPTLRGYPPSLFNELAKIVERLGNTPKGNITGFFTVLVEGDDLNEPVADTMRGLLDGHIVLERELAQKGHFPAISVLKSVSRVMNDVISEEHRILANQFRHLHSTYVNAQELINIGAYKSGSNVLIDQAILKHKDMEHFLLQDLNEPVEYSNTLQILNTIMS